MTKKSITKISLIKRSSQKNKAIKDDDNGWLTYSDLIEKVSDRLLALDKLERSLFFVYPSNNIDSVVEIIALLESCHALCLLDPNTTITNKKNLYKTYQPNYEFINGKLSKVSNKMISMHPELKLLLTTSGSTGNPKLVKLTMKNILHNAKAISASLSIAVNDIAGGHLALQYAFGLSVITSHLYSGASVRLTNYSFSDSEFWKLVRADEITHLPGVPFHFQTMLRFGLERLKIPSVNSVAQAGGALDLESKKKLYDWMNSCHGRLYIMYGQTEAAPRISTLQPEQFINSPNSVGQSLLDGRIEILNPDQDGVGEVIYTGPNVMMGYAETRSDLISEDSMHNKLNTGDFGYLDKFNQLVLKGRSKKLTKVFGIRVNTDDIELLLMTEYETAVLEMDNKIKIFIGNLDNNSFEQKKPLILNLLKENFNLPIQAYEIIYIPQIPKTDRGKTDYKKLS